MKRQHPLLGYPHDYWPCVGAISATKQKIHALISSINKIFTSILEANPIRFVLFCFVYFFFALTETAALRSIVLRYACAQTAIRRYHCLRPFSFLFLPFFSSFFPLEMSLFPSIFVRLPFFSLYEECTSYAFPLRVVFFYLVTKGWILDISLCENSIQSKSISM